MDYIICHYAEIGLKGKNRAFFERKLINNIKKSLPEAIEAKRISGRILIELKKKKKAKQSLKNVFGIAYFAFAQSSKQDLNSIKEKVIELLKRKRFKSFRITTQRSKKDFPLTSQEINERVGEEVVKKLNKKVDLEEPDLTCFIEIVENYAFLYFKKIRGPGGLPVSVSGKAISLLSGGIDSPLASYYGMKRGIKVIFIHFTSYPFTKKSSIEKAKQIIKTLNKYQFQSKLYLVPFSQIQKSILVNTQAKLRVILYRRFMFRIAERIAQKEKAKALITGESVGQVASQTLENIGAVEEAVSLPVLRPLIGMDKQDIINRAKEIKTFEISILPAQDCCQRFLPKHPETKAELKEVKREEEKLDVNTLVKETFKKVKYETI